MISIICVYNNTDILESCLIETVRRQDFPFELILLDNTAGMYSSAATALNCGAKKAVGDILVFCHQDIKFESPYALSLLNGYFERLGDTVIVGPAGKNGDYTVSNMNHGTEVVGPAGNFFFKDMYKVETLDECFFAVTSTMFCKMGLDERTCSGWHLYAVDYCLSVRKTFNSEILVVDIPVFHASDGCSMNASYYSILKKVCKKHRRDYHHISTTMGNFTTNTAFWFCTGKLIKAKIKEIYYRLTGHRLVIHK